MAENYFEKFPTITYNNTECKNLTRRVKIDEKTRNNLTLYYTYTVSDGTRPDIITQAYYEDPQLDWLLWLTNYQVDPYYQWTLSEQDFEDYLIKKYGSIEASQKKIIFYRNNWYDDDNTLTPSFYENHLDYDWKKYYGPVYGNGTQILFYKRREEDWVMETNQIHKLEIANTEPFVLGELVDVISGAVRTGGGEVTAVSNTYIMIKNIDGSFAANSTVTGETSNSAQTVTATSLVYQAISNTEAIFWSPVYFYDIENETNAYNRTINILDRQYVEDVSDQLIRLLNE